MIPELNGDLLQWLRGFYYVARTGSVRKAAELMHRNPSTISYQLKCLEDDLGTVLFDRSKKSMKITREGEKLLEWTISTFETLQGMRKAVAPDDGHLQGDIVCGATLPVAVLAAPAVSAFLQQHPDVHVRLERRHNVGVVRGVLDSDYDFGLTGVTSLQPDDHFQIFLKARPLLVLPGNHAWQLSSPPTAEELEQLPYVIFAPRDKCSTFQLHTQAAALQKKVVLTVDNFHLLMQFVRTGLGAAVVDELCYRAGMFGSDWSSITCLPLDHLLPCVFYGVLTRRQKYLSPQAQALVAAISRHFQSHYAMEQQRGDAGSAATCTVCANSPDSPAGAPQTGQIGQATQATQVGQARQKRQAEPAPLKAERSKESRPSVTCVAKNSKTRPA